MDERVHVALPEMILFLCFLFAEGDAFVAVNPISKMPFHNYPNFSGICYALVALKCLQANRELVHILPLLNSPMGKRLQHMLGPNALEDLTEIERFVRDIMERDPESGLTIEFLDRLASKLRGDYGTPDDKQDRAILENVFSHLDICYLCSVCDTIRSEPVFSILSIDPSIPATTDPTAKDYMRQFGRPLREVYCRTCAAMQPGMEAELYSRYCPNPRIFRHTLDLQENTLFLSNEFDWKATTYRHLITTQSEYAEAGGHVYNIIFQEVGRPPLISNNSSVYATPFANMLVIRQQAKESLAKVFQTKPYLTTSYPLGEPLPRFDPFENSFVYPEADTHLRLKLGLLAIKPKPKAWIEKRFGAGYPAIMPRRWPLS